MNRSILELEIRKFDELGIYQNDSLTESTFVHTIQLLNTYHSMKCKEYRRIIDALWPKLDLQSDRIETSFLPVRIFKLLNLMSCSDDEIVKTLMSSGTSGEATSRIYLDRFTARLQSSVLSRIVSDNLGSTRVPMLVLDSPLIASSSGLLSARSAALNGFRVKASSLTFALDIDFKLDVEKVDQFFQKYESENVTVFGFTSYVWETCLQILDSPIKRHHLAKATLLHGGGWKRLADRNIDQDTFRSQVLRALGISRTVDYYGMAEQTGSIFFQCEHGYFHTSVYSRIVIRDPLTLEVLPVGQTGLIQLLSVLPFSYPGHSILTEDIGRIEVEGGCKCGRKSTGFRVLGRLAQAELRGCSNVQQS